MSDQEQIFRDGESGKVYGDAREMVNDYLDRFSAAISDATGTEIRFAPLDEGGYTSVRRGSATVGVNVLEEQGVLLFLCRIMQVPDDDREKFYRRLLELNHLATSDGAFSVDRESDGVFLRALRSLSGLDYEEFEDMLHSVATVADEWDDRLIEEFG